MLQPADAAGGIVLESGLVDSGRGVSGSPQKKSAGDTIGRLRLTFQGFYCSETCLSRGRRSVTRSGFGRPGDCEQVAPHLEHPLEMAGHSVPGDLLLEHLPGENLRPAGHFRAGDWKPQLERVRGFHHVDVGHNFRALQPVIGDAVLRTRQLNRVFVLPEVVADCLEQGLIVDVGGKNDVFC